MELARGSPGQVRWAINFTLPAAPCVPQTSKWTKVLPVLMAFMLGNVCGIFQKSFERATNELKYPQTATRGPVGPVGDELEPSEVKWQELAGSRMHRSLRFLADPLHRFHVAVLCVVVEPLRLMHTFFMKLANLPFGADRLPPLLNELDEGRSLIVRVQQYYSTLLHCLCSRINLVWHWNYNEPHVTSMLAWLFSFPQQARIARRLRGAKFGSGAHSQIGAALHYYGTVSVWGSPFGGHRQQTSRMSRSAGSHRTCLKVELPSFALLAGLSLVRALKLIDDFGISCKICSGGFWGPPTLAEAIGRSEMLFGLLCGRRNVV